MFWHIIIGLGWGIAIVPKSASKFAYKAPFMNSQVKGLQIVVTNKISFYTYLSYENSITALLLFKLRHKRVSTSENQNIQVS